MLKQERKAGNHKREVTGPGTTRPASGNFMNVTRICCFRVLLKAATMKDGMG
jgi:hypothetical protein